jgi:hypothetical protein
MPFDLLPEREAEDIVRLRVARDGVGAGWTNGTLGLEEDERHCAIGWLLVATDWNEAEATQLALDYVWPALPPAAQAKYQGKIEAIYKYNDNGDRKRVLALFNEAIRLAERADAKANAR